MNCSVHAIMYSYYAVMATKLVKLPKFISISITILQILQMIAGMSVVMVQYGYLGDEKCKITKNLVVQGNVIYGSYFVLFLNYFIQSYLLGKKNKVKDS